MPRLCSFGEEDCAGGVRIERSWLEPYPRAFKTMQRNRDNSLLGLRLIGAVRKPANFRQTLDKYDSNARYPVWGCTLRLCKQSVFLVSAHQREKLHHSLTTSVLSEI